MTRPGWRRALEALMPLADLPLTWNATGYTSDAFQREVASPSFDGWSGDLADDDEAAVIAKLLGVKSGESLLDVACGYGRHALILADHYGLRVTGVDNSPALIAKARELAGKQGLNIEWHAMPAQEIAWRDSFDHAIIAFNSFSVFSPEDAPGILRAIHRALKPGGTLFLDLDNKPFNCRYGTCTRNWYLVEDGLVLQEVFFHEDSSVEVMRDLHIREDAGDLVPFICFKRIYARDEIDELLAACGFTVKTLFGNWDLTPLTDASPKIILVAERTE